MGQIRILFNTTHFQIIALTVFFGLYHGLAFLPVVLLLFGSKLSKTEEDNENFEETEANKAPNISRDSMPLERINQGYTNNE